VGEREVQTLHSYIMNRYYKLLANNLLCKKNTSVICKYTLGFSLTAIPPGIVWSWVPQNEMVDNGFLSESKLQSGKDLSLCWLYSLKIA